MKIYVAGKITGDKNYKEKFDAVEKLLASQGYSVMNPARLGNYPGFSWEEYMGVSTSMQRICDAVVFLPDWQESRGARIELHTAEQLGHKIYLWHTRVWNDLLIPFVSENTPFGRCPSCRREFNAEIVDKYEAFFCPWCGQKLSIEEKQG